MTIKESLINWLQLYPNFDISEFIDYDVAGDEIDNYALANDPTVLNDEFNDGSLKLTEYYTFIARKSTVTKTSRKTNDEFIVDFQNWILLKNHKCDYPTLDDNCYCDNISISSKGYLQSNENKIGDYVFTIEIIYRKEL